MSLAVRLKASAPERAVPPLPDAPKTRRPQPRHQTGHLAPWGLPVSAWLVGTLVWAVAVSLSLVVVYRYARVAQAGVEMTRMRAEMDRLTREDTQIEAQISDMKSISRIEKIATARLGMVKPLAFRTVPVDRRVLAGAGTPATPAVAQAQAPASRRSGN